MEFEFARREFSHAVRVIITSPIALSPQDKLQVAVLSVSHVTLDDMPDELQADLRQVEVGHHPDRVRRAGMNRSNREQPDRARSRPHHGRPQDLYAGLLSVWGRMRSEALPP